MIESIFEGDGLNRLNVNGEISPIKPTPSPLKKAKDALRDLEEIFGKTKNVTVRLGETTTAQVTKKFGTINLIHMITDPTTKLVTITEYTPQTNEFGHVICLNVYNLNDNSSKTFSPIDDLAPFEYFAIIANQTVLALQLS